MPEISVVMSVYNGERYLQEAMESVLDQTFGDFEFIIVDDGSTDRSAEIIQSYNDERIRLFRQNNRGLASALNVGLKMASGRYIARMDADDVSISHRFKTQYEFMESHQECVVVGSNAMVMDAEGEYLYTSDMPTEWESIRRLMPGIPFFHSSTFFRADAANKCGGYYEAIRHYFEDLIFFNRLSEFGELRNLEEPLIKYRLVPSAITNQGPGYYNTVLGICRNILRTGAISQDDLELLKKVTRSRTPEWKESNYCLCIGRIYLERNFKRGKAIENFFLSVRKRPTHGKAWFNLMLSFFPRPVITRWKNMRYARWRKAQRGVNPLS